MPLKTFIWFVLPSALAMLLLVALPLLSISVQSFFAERERVIQAAETCGPFGCEDSSRVDHGEKQATGRNSFGRFVGFANYFNRNHLALRELSAAWTDSSNWSELMASVWNLPFAKALAFTLVYTICVTPLVLSLGFLAALAINRLPKSTKGLAVFASILPMIVTPLIGALILFWMVDSRGVLGAALQALTGDPQLSLKSSPVLTWATLIIYGAWHHSPFAFVVLYAALQTVPQDSVEAAMIDGANSLQRVVYVVLPHIAPVMVFIALISLMDNFRVFEPIVGFNAGAHAQSLSWLIYNDLRNETFQLYGSAAATSVLTIAGVILLLVPTLVQTWRDFKRREGHG